MAAKASLLAPLAMEVGDLRGYRRQGRQATGLFLAMFTGVQTAAPAFISSSIVGYTLLAIYPAQVQAQFDFVHWFVSALPWFVPMVVLNLMALALIYRPRRKDATVDSEPDSEAASGRAKTSSWPNVASWAA